MISPLLVLAIGTCLTTSLVPEKEKDPKYWRDQAQQTLKYALRLQNLNTNVAKNVIMFLGDGMGVSTVTAARILKGQLHHSPGEETRLEMDKFPYVALSKCRHGHCLLVWGEGQRRHRGGERSHPALLLQHHSGERGHLHPPLGQGRWEICGYRDHHTSEPRHPQRRLRPLC